MGLEVLLVEVEIMLVAAAAVVVVVLLALREYNIISPQCPF